MKDAENGSRSQDTRAPYMRTIIIGYSMGVTDSVQVISVSAHHGPILALDGIDHSFPAGAVTALTGGNGSGKSTLMAVVAGVHPTTRGRVQRPPGGVALVRQSWSTERSLPLTVAAAITMGRWQDRGHWRHLRTYDRTVVNEATERLGLSELAGRQLADLSGGQRQRVLVAQALAQRAPVLLLDEPTAGVDAAAHEWIEDAMAAEAGRGSVVIHVTHDINSVQRADYHLHLEAGRTTATPP